MDSAASAFLVSMLRSLPRRLSKRFRDQRPSSKVAFFILRCAILAIQLPVEAQQTPLGANDQVTLCIIVVSSQDKACQVLDQLQQGADFGTLAKKLSIDTTADQGGFMGQVSRTNLRPELRDAVRNLHPGQLSSIVRIPLGFAIVKVLENQVITGMGVPVITQGSSAAGSVKYAFGVSGQSEANLLLLKMARDPDWNPEPHMLCDLHRESVSTAIERLKDLLTTDQSGRSSPNSDTMNAHFTLAQVDAYQGDMQGSVEEFDRAYDLAKSIAPDFVLPLHEALGISYLHKSEMDNEVYRKPGE